MKRQVLKMECDDIITVVFDDKAEYPCQYSIYYHEWLPNEYGVYSRRKYLVDKVWDMKMVIAWIADILNDKRVLGNSISKVLQAKYGR